MGLNRRYCFTEENIRRAIVSLMGAIGYNPNQSEYLVINRASESSQNIYQVSSRTWTINGSYFFVRKVDKIGGWPTGEHIRYNEVINSLTKVRDEIISIKEYRQIVEFNLA